ncbi:DUF5810 domain-containing protein [Natrarchaeobius oligotrophus]|uniref:Uncharacterized protein n=1 Tax=Natrarchaeobius chitinivorans TaxID=1679083 RepID=A0A3N6MBT7_NATCH|nr:DUF5810 domain-containing protein [Natrarchaeobius chitinivorans]RQH01259.1 hypothetical protein EA472_07340 [Natrarchaeobius chitinivorans]
MGYACPVCDAEQHDAVHLANHLAVTASIGRQDHREWLAEYAPNWERCGPEELGEIVSEYAREIETPEFEGTSHGHDAGRPAGFEDALAAQSRRPGRGAVSDDAAGVLEEARELTRQMQESSASGHAESDGDESDHDDSAGESANENA